MQGQDKIRYQIKDFEHLMDEARGVTDRQVIDLRREFTARVDKQSHSINELAIDRRQLKAMVKNQNFQFTELKKEILMCKSRLNQAERITAETPKI